MVRHAGGLNQSSKFGDFWVLMLLFTICSIELFKLALDPGETSKLAAEKPAKLAELIELWRSQRRELGIILPEDL